MSSILILQYVCICKIFMLRKWHVLAIREIFMPQNFHVLQYIKKRKLKAGVLLVVEKKKNSHSSTSLFVCLFLFYFSPRLQSKCTVKTEHVDYVKLV